MTRSLMLTLTLAAAFLLTPMQGSDATAAAGLPTSLGLGVAAAPDDSGLTGWMPNSGVPWDYAYQYLAAGVNTGQGWQTWNDQATFPLLYAQSARAHGYIPVFPYYMLYQSTGACDACPEAQRDLAHLNDATLMSTYYADFALLMKRLGPHSYDGVQGFGNTVIVHVEPDLSGYANQAVLDNTFCFSFCTGAGNDPSLLKASVASSGFADISSFANTYQGFSMALAHLRDLYAPNVILAFHISGWAQLFDTGSNSDPNEDARTHGRAAASFAISSGLGSGYSLVFNDVADRDAGFYKTLFGRNLWWDRNNVALPHFHQWESYIQGVHDQTSAPIFVWQIPVGNQVYRTENNTDGHYQDNRVEYLLSHTDELTPLGIIGLLFGPGADGPTHVFDFKKDGITNPASFCTTDGVSSGQICNTKISTSSDDDGGYLRETAAAFYGGASSIQLSLSASTTTYGNSVSVNAKLQCPANVSPANRTLVIEQRMRGAASFSELSRVTTAGDGSASGTIERPYRTGDYRARYEGASDCRASISIEQSLGVRVAIFASHPAATSIRGYLAPAHSGKRVWLQWLDGTSRTWRNSASAILDRHSGFQFTVHVRSRFLLFRVAYLQQDADHLGNVSQSIRVNR